MVGLDVGLPPGYRDRGRVGRLNALDEAECRIAELGDLLIHPNPRGEGQILGRLSHTHIARLLDAGFTVQGQRYLVLEYVDGERIDTYCDAHRLDVNARVALFRQVCEAVSHAHANLIVHRDLKPSNILVERDGTVKLLDFGVAKLLADEDTDATQLTRLAGAALTPEYAAPEQIEGGAITTATDVYALGVVLYGLLAGGRPYGGDRSTPAQLARVAKRRPDIDPATLIPVGYSGLREALERYIDVGFSKFVVRPAETPTSWPDELDRLAAGVLSLQT